MRAWVLQVSATAGRRNPPAEFAAQRAHPGRPWPCRSEVLEGASELRIMLCRPRAAGGERSSSSIVAACGIYMRVGGCGWSHGHGLC